MVLSRRGLLQRTAAGVLLVGHADMLAIETAPAGYGDLVDDEAGRLALPEGFRYSVVSEAGETELETGEPTPRSHDGTGAFGAVGGGTVLVVNHEIREEAGTDLAVPHLDGLVYDPGAAGGATIVVTDAAGRRVSERVGIAGTSTNCAGGVTPWGTWLTCEETDTRAGDGGFERDHGYVFEVDPFDRAALRDPTPIKALGRFVHEAVVVDPDTGDMYLTEDAGGPNGLLYRWLAPPGFGRARGSLRELGATAGVLAAMRCTDSGEHVDDLSRAGSTGTTYAVEWAEVDDRDGRDEALRNQLGDGDVTRAHKLEGAWWGPGPGAAAGAYVVSSYTGGGSPGSHRGQVWFYDPQRATLTLALLFTGEGDPGSDGPDNITVSPYGGVMMAEDGDSGNHLVGATADGATFQLARSEGGSEFAGPVFSRDGSVLFANIQTPGTTFAITGPWAG